MKISIFGLGYVGVVSGGCLAQGGHEVIGVDTHHSKVDLINQGRSPIFEKDIDRLISKAVSAGALRATMDVREAVGESELSLICVGTPGLENGSIDLRYVRRVCEQIGRALRHKADFHVVVVRSTVLPGSTAGVVVPALEVASKKQSAIDFGICNNPEFLREGTAVHDFYNPSVTVIGEIDGQSGAKLVSLYKNIDAPVIRTDIETSEMVKYADNVWHALKIGFANEIGNLCKSIGVDSHRVMDIFFQDTKLNLSSSYLKPGFAFGGSCLPKDVRALTHKAHDLQVNVPILDAIMLSNQFQIEKGIKMIMETENENVGILGLTFKAGTDDLRESPMVELAERLLAKGVVVKIYDRHVDIARLVGANRDYILNKIPDISKLTVDTIDELLDHAETVVIGNPDSEFKQVPSRLKDSQVLVDLVRIVSATTDGKYNGICW